jgi:hypothetical protein
MIELRNPNTIPFMQIRSKSIICYEKFINHVRTKRQISNQNLLSERVKYTGLLSPGAIKRMTKAIDLLISSTPKQQILNPVTKRSQQFRLSFITLTMPNSNILTASRDSKVLLEKMLRYLRNTQGMHSYVWKAETQENGQIHYHLTSNVYLHYQELRNYWNKLLFKSNLFSEYFEQRGDRDINSTDIHSVRKVKDLSAYLIKYFTKQEQNQIAVKGKVWDCSLNLKEGKYYATDLLEPDYYELLAGCKDLSIVVKELDHCTIFRSNHKNVHNYINEKVMADYYNYMAMVGSGANLKRNQEVSSNLKDRCIENWTYATTMPDQTYLFN